MTGTRDAQGSRRNHDWKRAILAASLIAFVIVTVSLLLWPLLPKKMDQSGATNIPPQLKTARRSAPDSKRERKADQEIPASTQVSSASPQDAIVSPDVDSGQEPGEQASRNRSYIFGENQQRDTTLSDLFAGLTAPGLVQIIGISARNTGTPAFAVGNPPTSGKPPRPWCVITVEYESFPEYIDELTFDYWVMIGEQCESASRMVLSKRTAYLDVEKGIHQSVMYLHPNTFARFGPARKVAIKVSLAGREVAYATIHGDRDRTWLAPTDYSRLLRRRDTPFSLIRSELFPFEKPQVTGMPGGGAK